MGSIRSYMSCRFIMRPVHEWELGQIILQTAGIYSGIAGKVSGRRSAVELYCKFNQYAV